MSVVSVPGFDRTRAGLWAIAALFFGVLVFVAWRYVGTVVLGLFVYYVTRPVFRRIHQRVRNRTLAVATAIVTVTLPVLLLVAWTVTIAVQELASLADSGAFGQVAVVLEPYLDVTQIRQQVEDAIQLVIADPNQLARLDFGALDGVMEALFGSLLLVANAGLHLFIVVVITFYLLRDDYRIAAWARRTFFDEEGVLLAYFGAVDRDLKNVYFGNILNALMTGLLGAVVYSTMNLVAPDVVPIPNPVLLGLLTGVASLVPVIGMKLVWVPVALLMLADSLLSDPQTAWFPVLFALVSVVVIDYIPDQLLRPYISGRSLHVGAIMLAYIFGPLLFGWYGIFFGPLVLVLVFEFARVVLPWLVDADRLPDGLASIAESSTAETPTREDVLSTPEVAGDAETGRSRLVPDDIFGEGDGVDDTPSDDTTDA
ncbi:AI-2E family transporter [Halorarius litoreus]|uniref:AI-2E family transporter n=1 Tax=Halorarius litoreus TaxID=2962676 RepID=UPI0020CCFF0E|nr:AI-2E family transporter [Halorarius litoreus]